MHVLQHINSRQGTPPSSSSLKCPVTPLLDLVEFAARPRRIVTIAIFFIKQPLGKLTAILRRQRALPLRPTRNVLCCFLSAEARLRLLIHVMGPDTVPARRQSPSPSYSTASQEHLLRRRTMKFSSGAGWSDFMPRKTVMPAPSAATAG